jgi:dTDP-4-amino-4,6-dideoxygalactose transaminase
MRIDFADLLFTGRGSSALWAILKSLNKSNAKVLLPVNICEIIYPIVIKAGYEPIFYDVDCISGNAGLDNIQDAFTGNETVLIAVHNFGAPLEIDKISKWAKEKNIFLIEDVCNAIGATYKEKPLGTFGDAAVFSFGYAKIVEYGVGGATLIKDADLKLTVKDNIFSLEEYSDYHKNKDAEYQRGLREIRQQEHAQLPSVYLPLYKEYSDYLLYKINLKTEDEIKQLLKNLDRNIEERAQKALCYRNEIKSDKVKHINEVSGQIYWRYNLLVAPEIRNALIMELRKNNILVSTWFPPIIELFEKNIDMSMYSGSRTFSKKIINLFVDHRVSPPDVSKTIDIINNF